VASTTTGLAMILSRREDKTAGIKAAGIGNRQADLLASRLSRSHPFPYEGIGPTRDSGPS
jgi:hypothetical protein